jgi:hypothetical protein
VDRLGAVVTDPRAKLRAVLAASKALIGLSRVNLSAVDVAIRARSAEDVVERLQDMEAWIASQATGACDQGPRINPVRRDLRSERQRVIVERRDRENEEPDIPPRSAGAVPPEPPTAPADSDQAATDPDPEDDDEYFNHWT